MILLPLSRPGSTLSRVAIWTGAVLAVGGMIWGLAVLGSKNSNTNVSYGT
ncbi:MAG: hypothetical protein HY092_02935, partial [Candidatus Kerfeldbacteria bacterium]|nr:hypothetical protein [Candidatus Kerfeldbacteria bacterium]